MAWTAPRTWVTSEVVTASIMNTHVRDNLLDLSRRTTASTASVATSQGTTSGTFVDLATVGPAVTVTTGTTCLVGVIASQSNNIAGDETYMGFAVSGATTVAASEQFANRWTSSANNSWGRNSAVFAVTGLTAGSNTFTAKYKVDGNTGTFVDRTIWALPIGAA